MSDSPASALNSAARAKDPSTRIRCAPHVLIGQDLPAFSRDVKQVWFDHVKIGEDDVERRNKDFADGMVLEIGPQTSLSDSWQPVDVSCSATASRSAPRR